MCNEVYIPSENKRIQGDRGIIINIPVSFLAIIQCTIIISEQVCMYWNRSGYFQYPFHQSRFLFMIRW